MEVCEEIDGQQDDSYRHASGLAYNAHVARYGKISKQLFRKALKIYQL